MDAAGGCGSIGITNLNVDFGGSRGTAAGWDALRANWGSEKKG